MHQNPPVPLTSGVRPGPYEVVAPIGAGGMGEVYRARDTRLGREVAIKVLPESFAADADRRARFEREAQAVAALSHPNVVAIFDTGVHEAEGGGHAQLYVVMELLERRRCATGWRADRCRCARRSRLACRSLAGWARRTRGNWSTAI